MIAEKLNIHQTQVSHDLKRVLGSLRESQDEDTRGLVLLKLEEYAEIKREAWDQWERSKLDAIRRAEESEPERECSACDGSGKNMRNKACKLCDGTGKRGARVTRVTETRTGQCGDPRFLQVVANCLQAERTLLNLDPPKEVKGNLNVINWDALLAGLPPDATHDGIEAEITRAMQPPQTPQVPAPVGYQGTEQTGGVGRSNGAEHYTTTSQEIVSGDGPQELGPGPVHQGQ